MGKIAFLHGRPGPHPFHQLLAESADADCYHIDRYIRWHDLDSIKARRYMSWLVCAFVFSTKVRYRAFLTEGPHFPMLLMRRLGLIARSQKTIALLDNESLYFIKEHRYGKLTCRALIVLLRSYDALVCVGEMQARLAKELVGDSYSGEILTCSSAISANRCEVLTPIFPDLSSKTIVFIGNGPSGWRGWYKGLDLLLSSVSSASTVVTGIKLKVIGEWDKEFISKVAADIPGFNVDVEFLGKVQNLGHVLSVSCLCVHIGRGEAWGISVIECMLAGLPALVSEWTGAKEAVEKIGKEFVLPLNSDLIAEKIIWYMRLPLSEKERLSHKAREIARRFTEERAMAEFRLAINSIIGEPVD